MNGPSRIDPDERLRRRIVAELDAGVRRDELEHGTRLDRMRRTALAGSGSRSSARRGRWHWPVAAAVAATVAVTVVVTIAASVLLVPTELNINGASNPEPLPLATDLDLLTSEDFELFTEDLAFYAWLAEQAPSEESRSNERTGIDAERRG